MAGNALAILLNINEDIDGISQYLIQLKDEFHHWMLPVFSPIIRPEDEDWQLLHSNFLYDFKNKPFHFHNGGSWPIFLGWLCWALNNKNQKSIPENIFNQYQELLKKEEHPQFYEYYTSDRMESSGAKKLCFSAVRYIMMHESLFNHLKPLDF